MFRIGLLSAMIVACVSLAAPMNVRADATVEVEVHAGSGSTDGQVSLTHHKDGSKRFTCTTSGGRCTMSGVPGGRYTVVFRAKSGESTTRKVMIPPDGKVKLSIATR